MSGSSDDKKIPQPAPSVDTPATVDTTARQPVAKPVKKGLFSWFSKKTAEPEVVEPAGTEDSASTAEPQQAEQIPSLRDQSSVVSTPHASVEVATFESAAVVSEQATSLAAEQPAATAAEAQPSPSLQPEETPLEAAMPAPIADVAELSSEILEPLRSTMAAAVASQLEPTSTPVAEAVLPTAAADIESAAGSALTSTPDSVASTVATEPARPAYSRFRISGGSDVVVPPAPVDSIVEPVLEPELVASDAAEPKLDANLGGQDKPQDNKASWFARLRQGLAKTSSSLGEGMASLFLGKKEIDDDLLDELETRLLTADVGMEATSAIMGNLIKRVARKELADSGALYQALQVEMADLLRPIQQPMQIAADKKPYVILVVGVNGAGKTTTIGKLAARLQKEGKKVMLAAGDTFRAAAVEQLQVWGERNKIPVIAQHTGADSASVIFDAVQAAKSRGVDVLIADTAGRLHTKDNLMEELRKVGRVMSKLDDSAPHEVLLVLDAGTGQNAINQTRQFNETIPLTGLALTKLDGTAKGGVIFALAKHFEIPVRYIGVGEGIDDLRDFVADDFVKALFAEKDSA